MAFVEIQQPNLTVCAKINSNELDVEIERIVGVLKEVGPSSRSMGSSVQSVTTCEGTTCLRISTPSCQGELNE